MVQLVVFSPPSSSVKFAVLRWKVSKSPSRRNALKSERKKFKLFSISVVSLALAGVRACGLLSALDESRSHKFLRLPFPFATSHSTTIITCTESTSYLALKNTFYGFLDSPRFSFGKQNKKRLATNIKSRSKKKTKRESLKIEI